MTLIDLESRKTKWATSYGSPFCDYRVMQRSGVEILLPREKNRINDMNDAINGFDVGEDNLCLVDIDLAVHNLDANRLS
jgi:hypothetical protein